jgi:arsenite methyltransferase
MSLFTLAEARAVLSELRPTLDEFVALRADAAELAAAVRSEEFSALGGLPELKALEAHIDELLTRIQQTGVEVKGFAPLLLDFPSDLDGVDVLLCWLEGDAGLDWYHRTDLGFLGRRRLPG